VEWAKPTSRSRRNASARMAVPTIRKRGGQNGGKSAHLAHPKKNRAKRACARPFQKCQNSGVWIRCVGMAFVRGPRRRTKRFASAHSAFFPHLRRVRGAGSRGGPRAAEKLLAISGEQCRRGIRPGVRAKCFEQAPRLSGRCGGWQGVEDFERAR